jgi:amino acid adenylation domain-containing protein
MHNRDFLGSLAIEASDYEKEKDYWLKKLSGDLPTNSFPYDYSKSGVKGSRMETVRMRFTGKTFSRIMKVSKGSDYIIHMIFTAGVAALFYRYTDTKDIVVGVPIYKQEKDADFLNTVLPLRIQLENRTNFKELLIQVKQEMLEANEHRNYPIETLLFRLNIPFFNDDEFPLFDVAVLLENIHDKKYIQHTRPNIIFSFLRTHKGIEGIVEYNTLLYEGNTIRGIVRHLSAFMEEAIFNVDKPVSGIDILSEEEKRQLLVDFNTTRTDYPAEKTIDQLFEEQVDRAPGETALTYEGEPITYSRLNGEADALASYLHSRGVKPEESIALIAENSHKVITAILGILKAGGAYLPLNVDDPDERKKLILKDCNAGLLLTNCREGYGYVSTVVDLDDSDIYRYDDERTKSVDKERSSDNLAYIMYTSGSTGTPRGVMVEHRNVVRLVKNTNFIEFEEGDSILLTGALEFDASTFEIWGALLNGLPLHLVSKETILSHEKLKRALVSSGAATMWMTSPFFNRMSDADIEIFKGLKNLLVGGDVLSPAHINRVRNRFPGLEVINGYGPTENTTFSITHRIDKDYQESIPIGKPISNSFAYILDSYYNPVPIGVAGELFVGGDGISRGYLNNPELTAEKFGHDLWDYRDYHDKSVYTNQKFLRGSRGQFFQKAPPGRRRQRIYKTGDLARWLSEGNIEFLGRIDQQVKIRGYRIEPGEIENHLMRIGCTKEAVVIDRENRDGEKYLCAYVVPTGEKEDGPDAVELRKMLSRQLPDYMVPAYFVLLEEIPLTPNGKVDRRVLPGPETTGGGAAYVAPRDPVEEKFVEIWSEVLEVDKEKVGIDADFFELGGHSLNAMSLVYRIHKELNVKLPLAEVFETATIRGLSRYIRDMDQDRYTSIDPVELKEYYPLSSAQKRLYVLQRMELDSTVYNVPQALRLGGELDLQRLEKSFKKLIKRHGSLRTSFEMIKEKPVQIIHHQVEFEIEYYDLYRPQVENKVKVEESEGTEGLAPLPIELETSTIKNFIRPFDLTKAPLLRVGLIHSPSLAGHRYILMVDMHHIITDGTSMDLFVKEFIVLFAGRELPDPGLKLQYNDYVQWQNNESQREALKQQEGYWLKQFEGEIPVLNLPLDYSRPSVQSFEGSTIGFELSAKETGVLNNLALAGGGTLYMVMLAIYTVLLSKLSAQEDIIVGIPIAARRHVDLERIIGMFVNTLAMRNYPRGEKTFAGFLREVKTRVLEAFENQEYHFEDLVDRVSINRDASRNPLFDVVLALPNMGAPTGNLPEVEVPGLKVESYESKILTAKFDLNLTCVEIGEKLVFSFEYCSKLFKESTIERFIRYFKTVVSEITDDAARIISEIGIIPEEDKMQILYEWNDTGVGYPKEKTIHRLFEEQVELRPDHMAVVCTGHGAWEVSLTYRELDEKSNQLARRLHSKGIVPDTVVGIMVEPSPGMVVGLLGILKSGGAYLPVNPQYPGARQAYLLKDGYVKMLLTNYKDADASYFDNQVTLMDLEDDHSRENNGDFNEKSRYDNLAYIIHTSGSSGRPKGVMVNHRNVVRLVKNTNYIQFKEKDRILQTGALEFDASTFEIWGAFLNGLELHLVPQETILAPGKLKKILQGHDISTIWLTSALFNQMLDFDMEIFAGLSHLLVGGDALSPTHINRLGRRYPRLKIINGYGPTENTTFSTTFLIEKEYKERIPIGKPISNSTAYIVDGAKALLPIGVPGELCLGGDGISRGYLNSPELTNKKFIYQVTGVDDRCRWDNKKLLRGVPGGGFLEKSPPGRRRQKIYRTGDLAKWLQEGNIEFLGRKDHQVKIRGFRIEPGEIETYLLNHESIQDAVVTVKERTDKYLCAYIVSQEECSIAEIKKYLSKRLPEYMIPSYFISIEKVPLTPNGKVERRALPEPEVETREDYVSPRNKTEEKLVEIWSEVLGIDKKVIGIDTNFFDSGGHSLKGVTLITKLHKELSVEVPLTEIFINQTVRELSDYIKTARKARFVPLNPAEKKEYYRMSSAQKRMFVLQQMRKESVFANSTMAFQLEGTVDRQRFEEAFRKLIRRHESLRTSFCTIGEEYLQKVHADIPFSIEYIEVENNEFAREEATRIGEKFVRPFALQLTPLLRVGMVKVQRELFMLMIDMHHIVTDGTSMGIFLNDLMSLYEGQPLPPLIIQYKDFAQWQNKFIDSGGMKHQGEYWLKVFENEPPRLDLCTDFVRPGALTPEGGYLKFQVAKEETDALRALASREDVTLFMILLAVYYVLLSKESGLEDMVVGSPVACRRHENTLQIIGTFSNFLALRNYPNEEKTFKEFLLEVKENTLAAIENQDYPFEELVKEVSVNANRDPGRNPLFDIIFAFQNVPIPKIESTGIKLEPKSYGSKNIAVRYDLEFQGFEMGDFLYFTAAYRLKLFREETVKRLIKSFKNILMQGVKNPHIKLSDIEVMSQEEKEKITFGFNTKEEGYYDFE